MTPLSIGRSLRAAFAPVLAVWVAASGCSTTLGYVPEQIRVQTRGTGLQGCP